MPKITLDRKVVDKLIGRKLSDEKLRERMAMLGSDPEVVNSKEIQVEVFPNRPDLLSEHGFSRAMASFLGAKTGLREYEVKKSGFQVHVNKNLKNIRPYTVCAIVKGLNFDNDKIKEIINVQEKLHITFCRNRKKAAIGVYPLEHIKFPVYFKGVEPEEIVFAPLDYEKEMDADEILKAHPKGREYAHLLEKYDLYPVFVDSNKNVLSLTPIINSDLAGKVTTKTKDVFIEVSGFELEMQKTCLNILVTALADMGGKIFSIEVVYPDEKIITPDLKARTMSINLDKVNKLLGLSLKESQLKPLLAKMGHGYKNKKVLVPGYRSDILSEADIIEDIAIAYGYENFNEELPNIATVGEESKFSVFKDKIAEILVGLNLLEVKTYHLSNHDVMSRKMNFAAESIELKNSKSAEFNVLRSWMIPSLLDVLSRNKHHEYPQNIFEASTVFYEGNTETKIEEKCWLSVVLCNQNSNFTSIKQVLDYLMSTLGIEYEITEKNPYGSHIPSFIEGRTAYIKVKGKLVAWIGEIHPQVLSNFGLEMPVAAFELNLSQLFELI
ncbi:MAG TPA: phenylalanine--tRNA ligase subunit beta [Candidatus Nanoarchaeia archaeon]|nr:phenylalanine--tRNA ligase subunit beta [Candidatus Nanoarchaeia archaeon]